MAIHIQICDCSARIAMSGRFDFPMHRDFKNAYTPLLDNTAIREIGIEMSKVGYMDSAALGMLMLLNERAKEANKPVALLNHSDAVSQILEVANFSKIFDIKYADGMKPATASYKILNPGLVKLFAARIGKFAPNGFNTESRLLKANDHSLNWLPLHSR